MSQINIVEDIKNIFIFKDYLDNFIDQIKKGEAKHEDIIKLSNIIKQNNIKEKDLLIINFINNTLNLDNYYYKDFVDDDNFNRFNDSCYYF